MVFSSIVFLFVFLPAFLGVYYLLPFRYRSVWLLVASYAFYGWWRVDFLLLFAAVKLWSYVLSKLVERGQREGRTRFANRALALGVVGDLGALAYFKYANFGVDNFNALVQSLGFEPFSFARVILPIGISFYVFQAISYLVDVHRGDARPARTFWDFAAFIALFPQLVAGPILRYKDVADQFQAREHSFSRFGEGAVRFISGFCKKVLIADALAPLVNASFALEAPTFTDAWLGALAYTLQLYFDFSAYSDMAIGLGLMIGFRFLENFNHPYISRSITEFWRRWHISLSNWLRDYLYIPLGGNRRGPVRTYVNLLLTMLLGGLWHGANWTFVIWGAWHGGILAFERWSKWKPGLPLTMLFVILGWVVFRAETLGIALRMYAGMIGLHGFALGPELAWQLTGIQVALLVVGTAAVYGLPRIEALEQQMDRPMGRGLRWARVALAPLFVIAVLRLSSQSYSPFLYFQF